jgi:hypothetical protein
MKSLTDEKGQLQKKLVDRERQYDESQKTIRKL